jgi:hypothetical protein
VKYRRPVERGAIYHMKRWERRRGRRQENGIIRRARERAVREARNLRLKGLRPSDVYVWWESQYTGWIAAVLLEPRKAGEGPEHLCLWHGGRHNQGPKWDPEDAA